MPQHHTPVTVVIIKNKNETQKITSVGKDVARLDPSRTGGNVQWGSSCRQDGGSQQPHFWNSIYAYARNHYKQDVGVILRPPTQRN